MPKKYKSTQLELARSQGYTRGLKVARELLVKAKNHQARMGKQSKEADADLKGEYEHGASVLHGLCLKLSDLLKVTQ